MNVIIWLLFFVSWGFVIGGVVTNNQILLWIGIGIWGVELLLWLASRSNK